MKNKKNVQIRKLEIFYYSAKFEEFVKKGISSLT